MATSPVTIVTIFMMLIPLCYTRTGRPSDAPIPLCLCRTPASTIPLPAQSPGGMAPDYLSLWRWQWFKCDWEDREGRSRLTKWSHASMVGSDGEVPVHCHPFFYSAPACAYLTTATRRICPSQ